MKNTIVDFFINDQGTIVVITPNSDAGKAWVDEFIPEDAPGFGSGFVVEHRFADDVITGIMESGMHVQPLGGWH